MSYGISSSKFHHPFLKQVLEKLSGFFEETNIEFYIIGATAREIIMSIHDEYGGRATLDLDIAIAITNWDEFGRMETGIVELKDFEKDPLQKQRFIYRSTFKVDIIPFGKIKQEDDKIFWPPDESIAMSILGFEEVQKATEKVRIDEHLEIEVASLDGIFLLKLFAWQDRNQLHNRDADDIAFIINNYLAINQERASNEYYEQIFLEEEFNLRSAGAKLLGIDIAKSIGENQRIKIITKDILNEQLSLEERSRLINQIIETNRSFTYEEAYDCIRSFLYGLQLF